MGPNSNYPDGYEYKEQCCNPQAISLNKKREQNANFHVDNQMPARKYSLGLNIPNVKKLTAFAVSFLYTLAVGLIVAFQFNQFVV